MRYSKTGITILSAIKAFKNFFDARKPLHFFGGTKSSIWTKRLVVVLLIAVVISGAATYAALNEVKPLSSDPNTVIWLLNLDLILLLLLVTTVARRSLKLWMTRRSQISSGSRLHVRLVMIFSLLAGIPAILMALFAAIFLHYGVQSWFGDRVRTAVSESQAVAQAYLEEHQRVIRADIFAMAGDLNRQAYILSENPVAFKKVMETQSYLRNFSEAAVFDQSGDVLASAKLDPSTVLGDLPLDKMEEQDNKGVLIMTDTNQDSVRALVKLKAFGTAYLYVSRQVDPTVLARVSDTRKAAENYAQLEQHLSDLQIRITLIFVTVALVLLFTAIGIGLLFARQLANPLGELIRAADRVRAGDLTARVPDSERKDEFDLLARTFNRMTSQLQEQRDELVAANRQLDQRRRFTETVLAGVSSGIIGLDDKAKVTLVNSSAADMMNHEPSDLVGKDIRDFMPELKQLLEEAQQKPEKITQSEIQFMTGPQSKRTFLVRIATELISEEGKSAVLTFDDITELQSAQRKAAWADVARRIAHEIKNPLTPIQLSAERLKRRYLKQIKDDPEIFEQCTDTIIHHVGDIGRMVNEFSDFARMPEAVIRHENLSKNMREIIAFQQQAHNDIAFTLHGLKADDEDMFADFDSRQLRQAVTNIMQNAVDSIEGDEARKEKNRGEINIALIEDKERDSVLICFSDNGPGFPESENIDNFTEPYVTQKERGTGLGLAIVKKIMEDHKGRIILGVPDWLAPQLPWGEQSGATVTLQLPTANMSGIASEAAE